MSPGDALAVFLLAASAGTAQAITGFGFGLLIIPPLVLLLGPRDAVALSTVLGTALSLAMLPNVYRDIAWRPLNVSVLASLLGSPLGLLAIVYLDKDVLQALIAVGVLVATALLLRGVHVPADPTVGPAVAGFVAGVTRMAAGLPGPPVVLYLSASGFVPAVQRGTVTAFFVATGLVGIVLFAIQGSLDADLAALALPGIPGILLGVWAGGRVFARISRTAFAAAVYVLLVASALVALTTAIR